MRVLIASKAKFQLTPAKQAPRPAYNVWIRFPGVQAPRCIFTILPEMNPNGYFHELLWVLARDYCGKGKYSRAHMGYWGAN